MQRCLKNRSVVLVSLLAVCFSIAPASHAGRASDCAAEADRAARGSGTVLGGAAHGAARGAVFGAIVGGGKGARRGAALGGVVGGARRGTRKNYVYTDVYDSCMRGYH